MPGQYSDITPGVPVNSPDNLDTAGQFQAIATTNLSGGMPSNDIRRNGSVIAGFQEVLPPLAVMSAITGIILLLR